MTYPSFNHWLHTHIQDLNAHSGSIHYADCRNNLHLLASLNIPDSTLKMIQLIPYGKGMAGQAQKRLAPWSTCDLSSDSNPVIQPQARHVHALGAIAYPLIHHPSNPSRCLGVVGFGFTHSLPHVHSDEYTHLLHQLEQCTQSLILSLLAGFPEQENGLP